MESQLVILLDQVDGDAFNDYADDGDGDALDDYADDGDGDAFDDYADDGDGECYADDLDKNVQRSVFGIPGVLNLRLPVTDGYSEEGE